MRDRWVVLDRNTVPRVYGPFQTMRDAQVWGERWIGDRYYVVLRLAVPLEGECS